MIKGITPQEMAHLTSGQVNQDRARVVLNMLDEIDYRAVSIKELDNLEEAANTKLEPRKPAEDFITRSAAKISNITPIGPNPEMVRELNITLKLVMDGTKRSNREQMQKSGEKVLALIEKFSQ